MVKQETLTRLNSFFSEFPFMKAESVPENEIEDAEQQLGIEFSNDYKAFVQEFGGAMVGPYPVFGLRHIELMDNHLWSVLEVTKYFREDGWPNVDQWLVVSMDQAGNPIGIDKDGSVFTYDHDMGEVVNLAVSFEGFIEKCLG